MKLFPSEPLSINPRLLSAVQLTVLERLADGTLGVADGEYAGEGGPRFIHRTIGRLETLGLVYASDRQEMRRNATYSITEAGRATVRRMWALRNA